MAQLFNGRPYNRKGSKQRLIWTFCWHKKPKGISVVLSSSPISHSLDSESLYISVTVRFIDLLDRERRERERERERERNSEALFLLHLHDLKILFRSCQLERERDGEQYTGGISGPSEISEGICS